MYRTTWRDDTTILSARRFVAVCDDIFLVTQLGISSSSLPTNLFVQTCMLYFVACFKDSTFSMPREQRHAIYALMDRQYVIMLRADPSRDLVLGLLILAFSSLPQLEQNVIYADPFRSSVLAYNMAADLGLEESMRKLRLLRPSEITWAVYEKLLRDVGLVSTRSVGVWQYIAWLTIEVAASGTRFRIVTYGQ